MRWLARRARRSLSGLAALAGVVVQWSLAPAAPNAAEQRFEVLAGASLWQIARELERAGIVRDARALVMLARWRGVDASVRAGEYALSPAWPAGRVLDQLVSGRVITYEVVLPEGLTAVEIAARLEAATLASADAFLAVVRDPDIADEFGVQGTGLEGYLFPETYRMPHGLPAKRVARVLVDEFLARWAPLEAAAKARGFDMLQTVTLASIVEKETGSADERPLVASVFWNRLAIGMRLESDPTTIYGIPDFDGNLRRPHLEDETNPWNTYRIAGLPPTPIANPGAASLEAVVRPAESRVSLLRGARGRNPRLLAFVLRAPRQRGALPEESWLPMNDAIDPRTFFGERFPAQTESLAGRAGAGGATGRSARSTACAPSRRRSASTCAATAAARSSSTSRRAAAALVTRPRSRPFSAFPSTAPTTSRCLREAGDNVLGFLGGISGMGAPIKLTQTRVAQIAEVGGTLCFELTGEGGFTLLARLGESPASETADTTIRVDAQAYRELREGRLEPQEAFLAGKIAVEGDMQRAMQLALAVLSPD